MKVLLINGNPRRNGNTHIALSEVASALNENDIETDFYRDESCAGLYCLQ